MKIPTQEQQLSVIVILIRAVIWLIWLLLIAVDGIGASSTLARGMYWLPWVFVGLLYAWVMDAWIREEKIGRLLLLLIPFMVLADFVQG